MTIEVKPITGALGATLTGLDLAHLDDAGFAALSNAINDHLVIYAPDQSLDRHQLAAKTSRHVEEQSGLRLDALDYHPLDTLGAFSGVSSHRDSSLRILLCPCRYHTAWDRR